MNTKDGDKIKKMSLLNEEGYVDIAEHFGMSRARVYSAYHQPWGKANVGDGVVASAIQCHTGEVATSTRDNVGSCLVHHSIVPKLLGRDSFPVK